MIAQQKVKSIKKRDALSELAFSGRHRSHSLWVLMKKYNSVSKDIREQIKWLCLFFAKDRDSFEDCLRENDIIPDKNKRGRLKKCLQDRPYSKLILKCYQPWLAFVVQLVVQLVIICYKFVDQLVIRGGGGGGGGGNGAPLK